MRWLFLSYNSVMKKCSLQLILCNGLHVLSPFVTTWVRSFFLAHTALKL